ncbi:MAG: hypothetical protein JW806_00690 [Sedimentisphaerales bacterium]|nr:hypothetical protein [Sedimentisphaerales bacterium]
MKEYKLISVVFLIVCIALAGGIYTAYAAEKEVKVQIHTTRGGAISESQIRGYIGVANQADKGHAKFVVDSNHVYDPNSGYDPNKNDPNRVNIWGLSKAVVTGEPNYVSGQIGNVIELVPGRRPGPNEPNDPNVWIKPSTLAHELNHILLGPDHSNDPNNKMYPDVKKDPDGVVRSCHRIGIVVAAAQFTEMDNKLENFALHAALRGHGRDAYDALGDIPFPFVDLHWAQSWMEFAGLHVLHLVAQVQELTFAEPTQIGFYIEADNNPGTGEPPEGLDYRVTYYPFDGMITLEMYEFGAWMPIDSSPIIYEMIFGDKDADYMVVPPRPCGVQFDIPVQIALPTAMIGTEISYKAFARNMAFETDYLPDVGLHTISYPPEWAPDFYPDGVIDYKDVAVMAENWLEPEPSNPDTDMYPDGQINNRDFAEFGPYWREIMYLPTVLELDVQPCDMGESSSQLDSVTVADPPGGTRFSITVQGNMLYFEDMIVANCCTRAEDIGLDVSVEGNMIIIDEVERIPGFCTCICDFPTTALLGPFADGDYIVEVFSAYPGDSLGTVEVTIPSP